MDKVLDTFYKGNVRHFGLGAWNSVKDDFNEVSKSQNIKMPFQIILIILQAFIISKITKI